MGKKSLRAIVEAPVEESESRELGDTEIRRGYMVAWIIAGLILVAGIYLSREPLLALVAR